MRRSLAFHHTRPFWSTHIVVVPKRHIASLTTVNAEDEPDIRALLAVVQRVARELETAEGAAGVSTNLGSYQDSKHLHIHVYAASNCDRAWSLERDGASGRSERSRWAVGLRWAAAVAQWLPLAISSG